MRFSNLRFSPINFLETEAKLSFWKQSIKRKVKTTITPNPAWPVLRVFPIVLTMAATHEVAPDALPFSDQEYEQLSTSNSNFAALLCKLSYLHTKDQFKWFGNFEELICLVKILLETNDTGRYRRILRRPDPQDAHF